MARDEKRNRSTTRKYRAVDLNQAEVFLYGKLGYRAKAKGYCDLHKCYLDNTDLSEKRCFMKQCRHLKGVK